MQSWGWNDQTPHAHAAAAASYAASQVASQNYSNIPAMQNMAQAQMAYQQYYGAAMPGAATPELTQQQLEAQQWQWNTWHQSFQQWQKEYGGQYQAAMNPMAAQGLIPPMGMTHPMIPDMARPPPVPPPEKPPPPPPNDHLESLSGQKRRSEEGMDPPKKPRTDEYQSGRSGGKSQPKGGRWGPLAGAQDEAKVESAQGAENSIDELSEQEKAFDLQFLQWENQFSEWKAANINHPDKNQYREYEVKWMGWREKLLQRREDMKQKREKAALAKSSVSSPLPITAPPPQVNRPPNQVGQHNASMTGGDNWGNRPSPAVNLQHQNLPGPQIPPGMTPSFPNRGSPNPQIPAGANAKGPRSLLDIPLGFMAEKANALLRCGQQGPGSTQPGPGTQTAGPSLQGNFAAARNQATVGPLQPRNVPGNAGVEQKNAAARNQAPRPGQQKQDGSNVLNFPKAIQLSQNTCQAIKGQQSGDELAAPQPEDSRKPQEAAVMIGPQPAPVVVDLEEEGKNPVNYDFLKKTNNGIPGLDFAETDVAPDTPNSNSQNDSLKFGQDSSASQDMANNFGPKIHTSQGQGFQFPKAPPPPPPPGEQADVSQDQGGNSQDANHGFASKFGGPTGFGSFGSAAVVPPVAAGESQFYMDDFDSVPATAGKEAGNDFSNAQQFSFGPQDQNPQFRGIGLEQNPGTPNQLGTFGNSGQTRAFPPNSQQISLGPKGQQNTFGPNSQPNSFGPSNVVNSLGPGSQQNSFGPNNQPNTFGPNNQPNTFGPSNQANSFGPDSQQNSFGYGNQPNSFGQGNQPNSFGQGNQPNSFGQGNQPNSFGQGNQSNSFGQGNQPNSFGQGNQPNSFGQGNQPNSFGQGNQPNSFGQGNQSNSFGQGNQPNSFGQGNQPNSFGQGNQPNTFGPNSQQLNAFGPNRPAPFDVKNQLGPNNQNQPNQPSNFGSNRNMPGMNQSFGPNQNKPLGFGRGQAPSFGGPQSNQRIPERIGGLEKSWNQAPQDRDRAQLESNDFPNEEEEEFRPEDYNEEWVRLNSDEPEDQPLDDRGSFANDGPNTQPRNTESGRGRGGMQGMRDQGSLQARPGFAQGPGLRPQGGRGSFVQGGRENFAAGDGDFPQGGRGGFQHGGRDGFPPGSRDMLQREGLGPNSFQQQGPNNGPKPGQGGQGGFARGPHGFPQGEGEHGSRDAYAAGRDNYADSFVRYDYGEPRGARDYGPRGFAGPYDRWNDQEDFYRNDMVGVREEEARRRQWEESTFELEPATIVEYGHKPAGPTIEPATVPAAAKFVPPVQTFDYGHGGAAAVPARDPLHFTPISAHFAPVSTHLTPGPAARHRPSPPPHGDSYRSREDHREFGHRDRDRERERDRERDYHSGRWERDRPPRREDDEDRYRSSRDERDRPVRRPDMEWDRERDMRGRDGKRDDSDRSRAMPPPPPSFSEAGRREGPSAKRDTKPSALPPVNIDDLVSPPGRKSRPPKIVIILRGPPGSGKSFAAKLIKEKETENGGSAPRILCLDDYFITEVEVEKTDPETGRRRKVKEMGYEYEAGMEKHYLSSLLKTFRKTVNENYFSFIIVDCVNQEVKHFEEMWSHAKQKGFQVYVCEMDADVSSCFKRNIHHRTEAEITEIVKGWEETPATYLKLDLRSLLQSAAITDVEMEDAPEEDEAAKAGDKKEGTEKKEDEDTETISKWEIMEQPTGDKLDRMDGLKRRKGDEPRTLEDWLATDDDYANRESLPGKKRVRWADLEEKRSQAKMRAIGFVVGQTDWSRMTDPTYGESALTQTKYI